VVYSTFAALVLFMIWLYLVWLIVLVGSAVSFYVQNPHYIGVKRDAASYGTALVEQVALIAAYHVVGSWYRGEEPWSADRLAREAHVPMPVLARVLASLEQAGLFERAGDDDEVFLPGRPPEATPVKDLLDAVRADEGTGDLSAVEFGGPGPVARVLTRVSTAVGEELTGVTVKDLAFMDDAPEGPVVSAPEAPDLKSI
jgi:membrane protein